MKKLMIIIINEYKFCGENLSIHPFAATTQIENQIPLEIMTLKTIIKFLYNQFYQFSV